jgi:hypothetical protein
MAELNPPRTWLSELENLMRQSFALPSKNEEMPSRDSQSSSVSELAELEEMMKQDFFHTDTTAIKYAYRPIGTDEDIRLFHLGPGDRKDPIKGFLAHISLTSKPNYEALSYTWGSNIQPYEILTDDGAIPITSSLQAALVRLRFLDRVRVLWVDALCINQQSNEEKPEQILLMPKIYSSASKVVVHLGPEENGSEKVFDLLDRIARTNFSALSNQFTLTNSLSIAALPETRDKCWIPFRGFWRRPWFRRVWVIQEFLLGRDVTFVCGEWEMDLDTFVEATNKTSGHGIISRSDPYASKNEHDESNSGVIAMERLAHLRAKIDPVAGMALTLKRKSEAANNHILLRSDHIDSSMASKLRMTYVGLLEGFPNLNKRLGESSPKRGRMSLLRLMDLTQGSQASDTRDRLFALLSLANDLNNEDLELLRPDYISPIECIVCRYAQVLVQKGQGMDMLYRAFLKPEGPNQPRLPSWIGDWISPIPSKKDYLGVHPDETYNAGGGSIPKIRIGAQEDVLIVSGRLVGAISKVSKGAVIQKDIGLLFPLAVNTALHEADLIFDSVSPYFTGESISDVKWKTLIANKTIENAPAPEQYGMQYERWRNLIKGMVLAPTPQHKMDMSPPELLGYFQSLAYVQNYKVGRTREGLVGLVPLATEVGDIIAVFEGGAVPFVLRGSIERPGMYRLIGGCYLHGMMNGVASRLPYAHVKDLHLH